MSVVLSICAGVGGSAAIVQPASAATTSPTPIVLQIPSVGTSAPSLVGEPEADGVKSWLVKNALRGVAGTIRGGAGKFIDLAGNFLDDGARVALRNNSGRIADVIDRVANIPDIATHMVRNEVYKGLVGFLGPGTANTIAHAVEGVLWILL